MYMGTDADSIINIPDLVKTFREGDHDSIFPSQVNSLAIMRASVEILALFMTSSCNDLKKTSSERPKENGGSFLPEPLDA